MRRVFLAAVLLGCGSRSDVAIDLLDLFPYTDAAQAVREIDLGSAGAVAHLRAGWSLPERLPDGTAGRWAIARRATVEFAVRRPVDARLVARCGLVASGAPRRGVVLVSLNGRRLGVLRPGPALADHSLRMPAILQRPGTNVLQLTNMLLSDLPRSRARERARALAVEWIRLEGVNRDAIPPAVPDDGGPARLVLPGHASVDVFVRLPTAAELVVDLSSDDPARAALTVSVALEGEAERILARDARPASRLRVPLPSAAGAPARLSFRTSGDDELALVRPRILGARAATPPRPEPVRPGPPPNVLLYIIDTLRADHLGCYGYSRPTSPRIDAFAARSILFTDLVAQSSWTKPATASILTGLEPLAHGASTLAAPIRPDVTTLAEVLHGRGYRTAAFVTNVNVRGEAGFRRGFDDFAYLPEDESRPTVHVPADELNAHVFRWLDAAPAAPFFLYVHASDPHAPYRPPPGMLARFAPDGAPPLAEARDPVQRLIADPAARTEANLAQLRALYDGEIAFADEAFGALVAQLAARGLETNTLVVLAADHGEEFLEHGGFEHGRTLYAELLRVPLVLHLPHDRDAGRRIDRLVQQIDVLPTLLALLDIPAPPGLAGRDALATAAAPVESFSHTSLGPADVVALATADWTVIHRSGRQHERFEVYDLRADPGEHVDLAARRPILLGYGRQMLARRTVQITGPASESIIDRESARRLRALGYVSD